MTKHIDKIVPLSAISLSIFLALFAYQLASANSLLPSQQKENEIQDKNQTEELAFDSVKTKPKILLVPGHENEDYGAEYKGLKEAELNLRLAIELKDKLSPDFDVYLTRNEEGYEQIFQDFFNNEHSEISDFIFDHKNATKEKIEQKLFEPNQKIKHNKATEEMITKLYGFNKWSDENEIDLVLHIHFNDYPRKNNDEAGKYKGFSIYIPEKQLPNHKKSLILAEYLQNSLLDFLKPSNLNIEKETIIESQTLIAVGANNTLNTPSVLVEYSYIYEDFLQNENKRYAALEVMVNKTRDAIKDYFILESSS